MHVLKDCEVSDAILFLIASHTSLMQVHVHTKATVHQTSFLSFDILRVGARWYKAIASRRFGVTAFRILSRYLITNLAENVCKCSTKLRLSWNTTGFFDRVEPRKRMGMRPYLS